MRSECPQSALRVPSECPQSAFRVPSECLQSAFRVPSECLQSAFRVPSECLQSFLSFFNWFINWNWFDNHNHGLRVLLAHLVCQFLAFLIFSDNSHDYLRDMCITDRYPGQRVSLTVIKDFSQVGLCSAFTLLKV